MQTFKKIFTAAVGYLLAVLILSLIIVSPFVMSDYPITNEAQARRYATGTVNYAFLGASHGVCAFIPSIADREMDVNSYNYSNALMTMEGKEYIIRKELERNPVDTVVIEVAYNTLARDRDTEGSEGDLLTAACLDSVWERIDYALHYIELEKIPYMCSLDIMAGMSWWKNMISGNQQADSAIVENKGYSPHNAANVALSENEAENLLDSQNVMLPFPDENIRRFNEIIDICKENGCKVIVVTVPIADSLIWEGADWDIFTEQMNVLCEQNEVQYYDFNLLKDRFLLFSDEASYYDTCHLSEDGAEKFTEAFSNVMNQIERGETVDSCFFSSYEEMKNQSPYMQFVPVKDRAAYSAGV